MLEPFLAPLVGAASDFSNCPKHIKKIHDLIGLWEEKGYFAEEVIPTLRAAVEQGPSTNDSVGNGSRELGPASSTTKVVKEPPFIMPAIHGDPTTPWYDLPAGNWLTALEPNSTRPMNPSMIRPLQLAAGPANKTLVEAVKNLLVDVDKLYATDVSQMNEASFDIDQMGEHIEIDEVKGDVIGGDTYYGWSRAFCEKMKARRKKRDGPDSESQRHRGRSSQSPDHSRSRSRSPGRSRSSSRVAMKRRRISTSPERRGRNRSRSRGSSKGSYKRRSWSRSRSSSGSRSRARPSAEQDPSRGRSPSPRYSPPPAAPAHQNGNGTRFPPFNELGPPPFNQNPYPTPPPMGPMPTIPPPHPGFGGFQPLVPPPPPPNYQGQWPPPPPPPPPMGGVPQNFFPGPNTARFVGGWAQPPPPPPPPPPQHHPQQHPHNQYQYGGPGNGNFRGGGRGGYGRGGW